LAETVRLYLKIVHHVLRFHLSAQVLLDAALDVSLGPLQPSWIPLELERVLSSFTILEPHH